MAFRYKVTAPDGDWVRVMTKSDESDAKLVNDFRQNRMSDGREPFPPFRLVGPSRSSEKPTTKPQRIGWSKTTDPFLQGSCVGYVKGGRSTG